MNTKEKAPTSAATLAEAAAETTVCRASIPIFDCTTAAEGRQRKVSDFLSRQTLLLGYTRSIDRV